MELLRNMPEFLLPTARLLEMNVMSYGARAREVSLLLEELHMKMNGDDVTAARPFKELDWNVLIGLLYAAGRDMVYRPNSQGNFEPEKEPLSPTELEDFAQRKSLDLIWEFWQRAAHFYALNGPKNGYEKILVPVCHNVVYRWACTPDDIESHEIMNSKIVPLALLQVNGLGEEMVTAMFRQQLSAFGNLASVGPRVCQRLVRQILSVGGCYVNGTTEFSEKVRESKLFRELNVLHAMYASPERLFTLLLAGGDAAKTKEKLGCIVSGRKIWDSLVEEGYFPQ